MALLVPVVAVFAVIGVAFFRSGAKDVGMPAPSFDLERLDGGGRVTSDDLRGKAYVLNFWASWCIPCREEAPILAEVAGSGTGEPAFVGVNILDGRREARAFVEKFGLRYPNVRDDGGVFRSFRVTGIPETLFVARDGRLVGRYVGAIGERRLRELMKRLVRLQPGGILRIEDQGPSVDVP